MASRMLDAYPADLGGVDKAVLAAAIDAATTCSQVCTACADACLSESGVGSMATCIRNDLDCADVCAATARVLSRHTGYDANLTRAVLAACIQACATCADDCESHGDEHAHCAICAEACRACETACRALLESLG